MNEAGAVAPHPVDNDDSLAVVNADWHWTELGRGAEAGYATIQVFGSLQSVSVVRYLARRFRTAILHCPGMDNGPVDSLAIRGGFRMAVNGSYFNMRELQPITFLVEDHEVVSRTAESEMFRTNGMLALRGRGGHSLRIMYCDTSMYVDYSRRYHSAIASGPVLMLDGAVQDFPTDSHFYGKRHPRTIVGQDRKGNVYFIVIDGRFPGKADGVTIPEASCMAKWLGLRNAINFDGGGSSALWTSETGILSHPSDNGLFDHAGARCVPNVIVAK